MSGQNLWWGYLHFHLPNYLLAVVMYTMLGRLILGFFVPPHSKLYIWVWFCRITEPFLRAARLVTPEFIPPLWLLPIAAYWALLLRIVFYMAMSAAGQVPRIAGTTGAV